ncbi:MAG: DNA-binding protein [Candidatus Bathyarchaeia archaeon]
MAEDEELELLKRKKLQEIQRRLAMKRDSVEKPEGEDRGEALRKALVGRAWEVLMAAKRQYPRAAERVEAALARAISEGKIKGPITGEQLLWLFRYLGLNVRLETRIRIYEHGELKSIAEKLRGED